MSWNWDDFAAVRLQVPVRVPQLLVVLVTLLTLPVYGLAGVTHRSCQEQMRSAGQAAVPDDCCPGKGDPSTDCKQDGKSPLGKNGSCSACKAGYNCKSPQSYQPTLAPGLMILPARPTLSSALPPPHISHSPDGLWRPPAHI